MKTKLTRLVIIALMIGFLTNCKKTKLTGEYENLVGTWHWSGGWSDHGSKDIKLDLKERGRYKLYKDGKKIEHGRLLKDGKYIKFIKDFPSKFNLSTFKLHKRKILNHTDTQLSIGLPDVWDGSSSGFEKN
jgi:hypothetical protein